MSYDRMTSDEQTIDLVTERAKTFVADRKLKEGRGKLVDMEVPSVVGICGKRFSPAAVSVAFQAARSIGGLSGTGSVFQPSTLRKTI